MTLRFHLAIVSSFPASLLIAAAAHAQWPTIERVSVDSSGIPGNSNSAAASISVDCRFVAFNSAATNLVMGDTNGFNDVFVRDRQNGTTERISVATGGSEANDFSRSGSISATGRFVAFSSRATNLVAADTNGCEDVFVRDRTTATTERVSLDAGGVQGSAQSWVPSISADGRFVAFMSDASNLVAGDTNGFADVFVRDRRSGTTERVSVDSNGAEANSWSFYPSISADGRCVAFQSWASNFVPIDTNGSYDIFVRDRQSATTERVSVDSSGSQANISSYFPAISADGRCVAFESDASNLVGSDTNGRKDIFVHDRISGTTERVSVATGGTQANHLSQYPSISADGRWVVFESIAGNLIAGGDLAPWDVFLRDRTNGTTERMSEDAVGAQANHNSYSSSISVDGRFVGFYSNASNLVVGDTGVISDVFVRDRGPQAPYVYCASSISSHGCSASIAASALPSLSQANMCNITIAAADGQQSGILFYGIDNTGFLPTPWAQGSTSLLCVKHPTQRTPIQSSGGTFGGCDGSYMLDWNAYQSAHPLALGNPWSLGAKVYAQAWFRDPLAVKSTNLSNAVELTYVP